MKRLGTVLSLVIAALVVSVAISGDSPRADRVDEDVTLKEMRATVRKLAGKIDKLEARVAELEKSRTIAIPAIPPQLQQLPMPEEWGKREFNGIEYYIIPLREVKKGR